jgi:zinc transporter ZupT
MKLFSQLLAFGLLAAAGALLGGWAVSRSGARTHQQLKALIALGAGFMLAAVFLEVVPQSLGQWPDEPALAMTLLLAGYLLTQLVEHTMAPHFHFGEETHAEAMLRRGAAMTAVLALAIHAFFDGVAIASGLLTNFRLGFLIFLAVLLHKVPEGFTVASIVLSAGHSLRAALHATLLIAALTFAGIVLVVFLRPAIIYTLPLSAGVTLYVAASDLIPEVNHSGGVRASLLVFAGVALFYLAHLLLHEALGL